MAGLRSDTRRVQALATVYGARVGVRRTVRLGTGENGRATTSTRLFSIPKAMTLLGLTWNSGAVESRDKDVLKSGIKPRHPLTLKALHKMPDSYQGLVTALMGRLSKHVPLRDIFTSHSLSKLAEDAVLWCISAVAVKARMISDDYALQARKG
jgi:hypothetical protein